MKNKILLIYPKFYKVDFDAKSFPLGLLAIGTILENKGYRVKLIDFLVEDNPEEILKEELDDDVLCVGFSVMTPQIANALEIGKFINDNNRDIPIVWGGIHATLFPQQTIENSAIDFIIKGEGEISFPRLLKYFTGDVNLDEIPGLVYKKDGKLIMNPERDLINLNDIPILDYSLLSPKTLKFGSIILNTSRGCPFLCTFCVNIALHNQNWRFQTSDKVVEEVDYIINDLGYSKLKFQEDNFFVSKPRVLEIIAGIKDRGLKFKWIANCRVDFFRDGYIDDEFLEKLVDAGCYKLMFGAESGSQRILDFLKKGIKVEQIVKAATMCQNHGIISNLSFMCALPTETRAERIQTLRLIDKLLKIGPLVEIIAPQPYRPYPGDELARHCEKLGYKFPDTLEDWPSVVAKSLDSSSSNLENFSWIKDPNEIRLQRVCAVIATSRKTLIDYIKRYPIYLAPFISIFYLVEKLRWRFKYFGLPLEYSLFIGLYWRTQKLRKRLFIKKST